MASGPMSRVTRSGNRFADHSGVPPKPDHYYPLLHPGRSPAALTHRQGTHRPAHPPDPATQVQPSGDRHRPLPLLAPAQPSRCRNPVLHTTDVARQTDPRRQHGRPDWFREYRHAFTLRKLRSCAATLQPDDIQDLDKWATEIIEDCISYKQAIADKKSCPIAPSRASYI